MRRRFLIILLILFASANGQDTTRCLAISNNSNQCDIYIVGDSLCKYHGGDTSVVKIAHRMCIVYFGIKGKPPRCTNISRDESELCIKHKPK